MAYNKTGERVKRLIENFDKVYDSVYTDLTRPKTINEKIPIDMELAHDIEVIGYSTAGVIFNGKLGSQQQIKLRKSFDKFVNDLIKWTDPRMNILVANKIHYEHLKQKKLKEL